MVEDELLDLVDGHDRVVGTILRSQSGSLKNRRFLRAAEAFVLNSKGQLWIPRRQLNKRIAPGGLDYSMGEHVKSGERYLEGCIRGFEEELNMSLNESDLQFVKIFRPIANLGYFRALYIYRSDKSPDFNPQDFSDHYWLSPKELLYKLEAGEPAKDSLKETTAYLIKNRL